MTKELYNSCIVEYDEVGNVIGVYEIKTLKQTQIDNLKKQAKENLAKKLAKKEEDLKLKVEKEKLANEKDYRRAVVIAKQQFNELVECGKSQTTDEFETVYDNFIFGGEIDLTNAPTDFKIILERVK